MMRWVENDGGRMLAGFKGGTGDCVVRAIAIAARKPYREVYDRIQKEGRAERRGTRGKRSNARMGVYTKRAWFKRYMAELDFVWEPTMTIGSGCKVHLRADQLPPGRLIVSLSRHYAAVIDGVVHDSHDPTREGERCVYGYWSLWGTG
jgi:hypothetical protein